MDSSGFLEEFRRRWSVADLETCELGDTAKVVGAGDDEFEMSGEVILGCGVNASPIDADRASRLIARTCGR